MKKIPYKFEKYASADFPVYASVSKNTETIIVAHYHEDAEIIKVTAGTVRMFIGTEFHLFHEGDIIFLFPMTMHEAIAETADAAILGFIFDSTILGKEIDFSVAAHSYCSFSPDHEKHDILSKVFDDLQSMYYHTPPAYKLRIKADLLFVTSVLIECRLLPLEQDSYANARTASAIRYIKENYEREITISELSSLLHVCNDSFIRIFKAEQGKTPFAYILDLRICEAMKLLAAKKYSVSEIASRTGFSSASYFIKIFKEKLGTSPAKYKKEHF